LPHSGLERWPCRLRIEQDEDGDGQPAGGVERDVGRHDAGGDDADRDVIAVTAKDVQDPAHGYDPDAGKRVVGVHFTVKNVGPVRAGPPATARRPCSP